MVDEILSFLLTNQILKNMDYIYRPVDFSKLSLRVKYSVIPTTLTATGFYIVSCLWKMKSMREWREHIFPVSSLTPKKRKRNELGYTYPVYPFREEGSGERKFNSGLAAGAIQKEKLEMRKNILLFPSSSSSFHNS